MSDWKKEIALVHFQLVAWSMNVGRGLAGGVQHAKTPLYT